MATPRKTSAQDLAAKVARAHTDLTIFYAVIAMLEGGTLGPDVNTDASRIIAACKRAAGRCLVRMDAANAKLGEGSE